jgi:glycosyltransferase involved in cell wall biosynthesis
MSKKVLFFDHSAQFGGAERSLLDIIAGLKKIDGTFITSNNPILLRFKEKGIKCILFPIPERLIKKERNAIIKLDEIYVTIKLILRFRGLLRKEKPDLVYTNTQKAHIIGGVAAKSLGVPVIVHFRDIFDDGFFSKIWIKIIYFMATNVIVISNAVAKQFPKTKKVKIIYNGIRIKDNPFNYRKENKNFIVGYAGQIARWKGVEYFIQAANMVTQKTNSPVNFVIVGAPIFGDEKYLIELKELTKQLKMEEKIQFKGLVENAMDEISQFDVLVHPSILPEPFGRVLIESGALCKPVIATNTGAIPEIIVNDETGILVPVENASAIADALFRLIDNRELLYLLGQNANKRVKEYFNLTNTIKSVQNMIINYGG